ncbi:nuclear transport factor 2 family protein [Christiangramia sabulilitoris]|uniref:Nuclear transport factor 2 family protein n=1 Tax=Christiangramia sabulilitoris TaxID=2583991 RepID=A0A550I5Y4_9FLAO|nr:nuclear transport factor 2 family protein [Christiangramia sabulilitoris]TRO66367.1 nuclear transport factor 2 family protein [Christiangramia sabulilitoris]
MGLRTKEIVRKFYESNFYKDESVLRSYLHPDVELSWYGTTGLRKLDLEGIAQISEKLAESYESLRAAVDKVIAKSGNAAIHFTYYVRTIENPDEEMPLGHFIAMWELKDGKLYKGVQISQLGEEIDDNPWS